MVFTVSTDEGIQMAQQYGLPFFECSAKSGDNVPQIFEKIGDLVLDRLVLKKKELDSVNNMHDLLEKDPDEEKKKGCCA